MAALPSAFFKELLMPRAKLKFALAGTGIGLFGDVVDFFTSFVDRNMLFLGLILFAAVTLYLCWKIAGPGTREGEDETRASTDCQECNATRFGIFAAVAFLLLSFIGQGESATAKIGEQLGVIQRDVADIKEVLEPQTINDNPETMADHFSNAFVYHHHRNDAASAMKAMQALYALGAPNKLDAAQLYYDTHATQEAKAEILAGMERIGIEKKDGTLLVVAARHSSSKEKRDQLVALAQRITPDLPQAWWDPMIPREMPRNAFTKPGEEAARLRAEIASMKHFLALEEKAPPARWFYMPAWGAGYSSSAQGMIAQYEQLATQYEDMESGKFQREIREKLARERAKGF